MADRVNPLSGTVALSGHAGAQLYYCQPFQLPFGRVGGTEDSNLDAARTVDRHDFGGGAEERDLEINIVRL